LWRHPTRGLADIAAQQAATYAVSRDRLAGYRDAIEGRAAAAAILGRTPRPTALLCLSDRLAEGVLKVARRLGLRVPEDLSVIGFDDAPYTAAVLDLTTVRQPHLRKGENAARVLLDQLNGSATAVSPQPLPTELIIRGSTAPPPS
jgi:DNA-binding LacI/PurR family transcriptional regulator